MKIEARKRFLCLDFSLKESGGGGLAPVLELKETRLLQVVEGRGPSLSGRHKGEVVGVLTVNVSAFLGPGLAAVSRVEEESVHINLAQISTTDPDLLGTNVGRAHEGESFGGVVVNLAPVLTVIGAVNSN
jgi:hypothetical protein